MQLNTLHSMGIPGVFTFRYHLNFSTSFVCISSKIRLNPLFFKKNIQFVVAQRDQQFILLFQVFSVIRAVKDQLVFVACTQAAIFYDASFRSASLV
jgi:hypothetical protein